MAFKLRVWGEFACFTRPELKVERVSYDVMTPSAAVGILEAIYWKPAIRWHVDKISVLKPIRFQSLRTNEVKSGVSPDNVKVGFEQGDMSKTFLNTAKDRTQRTSLVLVDVDYIIEAHFTETGAEASNPSKHASIFKRRAEDGQCFHQPALGIRGFPAMFELLTGKNTTLVPVQETRDLGLMLHHIDHQVSPPRPAFFRAILNEGVISVPPINAREIMK